MPVTRVGTSRSSKANKFPRKRSIRFKSSETVALINFLSFFANLPEKFDQHQRTIRSLDRSNLTVFASHDAWSVWSWHKFQMPWLSDRGCSTKGTLTRGRDGHFVHMKTTALWEYGAFDLAGNKIFGMARMLRKSPRKYFTRDAVKGREITSFWIQQIQRIRCL